MTEGKYIRFDFDQSTPSGKTFIWKVIAKDDGIVLGKVSWFGRWRKYVFEPNAAFDLVFEETCLRDIAAFIEFRSKQQRELAKQRRQQCKNT